MVSFSEAFTRELGDIMELEKLANTGFFKALAAAPKKILHHGTGRTSKELAEKLSPKLVRAGLGGEGVDEAALAKKLYKGRVGSHMKFNEKDVKWRKGPGPDTHGISSSTQKDLKQLARANAIRRGIRASAVGLPTTGLGVAALTRKNRGSDGPQAG